MLRGLVACAEWGLGWPAALGCLGASGTKMACGASCASAVAKKVAHPALVSEEDFDGIFARIQAQGIPFWADPGRSRPQQINHNDGGRGVYWNDPNGHYLEIITRPYGSGG